MLNWKSQRLDLQESRLTEQTVDVDGQRMRRQFGVEARA